MYQSPIDLISDQVKISMDGEICKAVQNIGIKVDKNELLKALQYDRGQYQKGYNDRDKEIVHCKDCKHYEYGYGCKLWHTIDYQNDVWFCADGERKRTD